MHGRPRAADPARRKEDDDDDEAKISQIQSCLSEVLRNHRERVYSKEALRQNAKLLEINPEVYTAWNYRKLAVTHLLHSQLHETSRKSILDEELQVVEKALRRNVKSYGAWFHRKWVIQFGLSSLEHEYQLLDYLLNSDARNFHGWSYRRFLAKVKKTTENQELEYTIKKINQNFSNYSAWHARSVLLSKKSLEDAIEKNKWLQLLTEEYDLVKQAFFTEPEDQSGWFYLTWLLGQTLKPSGTFLTGFWPPNGSSVMLNLSPSSKPSHWQYKSPLSKVFIDCCHLCIVLCFNKPVSGVDSTSISLTSSPEVHGLGFDVSWTPLRGSKGCSRVWFTNLEASRGSFVVGALYTIYLDVGSKASISTEDGVIFSLCKLSFNIEVHTASDNDSKEDSVCGPSVVWLDDKTEADLSECEEVQEALANSSQPDHNIDSQTPENWQLTTIQTQIDTCRELLDLEQDSKWTMLILARLLIIHSNLSYSVHAEKPHLDEVREIYHKLGEVDPMHSHFYDEQLSQLLFEQITSSPHKISKHCWKFEKSNGYYEGWLRLNNLSLSKIGHFDKLIWVQRLDLSNNKLQSVEGIEALQLLVSLDVSYNHLRHVTSLWPIHHVSSLKELNIKCNQIGAHSVDTKRYLIPSCLNNSTEEGQNHSNCLYLWEVLEVFKGLALRQLEAHGNPVTQDNRWRKGVIQALPSLLWLDGISVSS